jgi:hypothetical protein
VLESYGRNGADAYDLVDRLPRGRARAAAWNAYVCQTYADKLALRCTRAPRESVPFAQALYDLALTWLRRAHDDPSVGSVELELPPWGSLVRSYEQLVAMRETLEALRTYVAYDVGEDDPRLVEVDGRLATVDALWDPHPTPDLRSGIGDALVRGIRAAAALGAACALE